MESWIDRELDGCCLPDGRLHERLGILLSSLSKHVGDPIPLASQDWAATKAAYRFLSNPRVDEGDILAGHFDATSRRAAAANGSILVLHDTTEFSFKRKAHEKIGHTRKIYAGKHKKGQPRMHTQCGILLHASLVVTEDVSLPKMPSGTV